MELGMATSSKHEFKKLLLNQVRQADDTLRELERKEWLVKEDANTLFRFMHNIKSTSSSIGYYHISEAVHHIEDTYFQALSNENVCGQWKDLVWITKGVMEYIDDELEKIRIGIQQEVTEAPVDLPYENQCNLESVKEQIKQLVDTISEKEGKRVHLAFDGFSTQIPESLYQVVIEAILHFVTNAVDHGIEKEEKRTKKGKNAIGKVMISVKRLPGEIIVVVDDDGQGIQKQRVYQAAKKQGYVKKPFEAYLDSELFQLLYQFGVTTQKRISIFSGRGIGIMAAYRGISEVGGFIVIDSKEGFGSTFIIKLPVKEE